MPDYKKFAIEERVRWGDVDAARIIFYGAYIHFFEFAETELFRAVGLHYGVMFDELNIWLPRVHLECDFLRIARLDDILEVSVWVGRFGTKSMRLNLKCAEREARSWSQPRTSCSRQSTSRRLKQFRFRLSCARNSRRTPQTND